MRWPERLDLVDQIFGHPPMLGNRTGFLTAQQLREGTRTEKADCLVDRNCPIFEKISKYRDHEVDLRRVKVNQEVAPTVNLELDRGDAHI